MNDLKKTRTRKTTDNDEKFNDKPVRKESVEEDAMYNVKWVADYFEVSVITIKKTMKRANINPIRIGNNLFLTGKDINDIKESSRNSVTQAKKANTVKRGRKPKSDNPIEIVEKDESQIKSKSKPGRKPKTSTVAVEKPATQSKRGRKPKEK